MNNYHKEKPLRKEEAKARKILTESIYALKIPEDIKDTIMKHVEIYELTSSRYLLAKVISDLAQVEQRFLRANSSMATTLESLKNE